MKSLFLALALLTAGCTQSITPDLPGPVVTSPIVEDQRSTEPAPYPGGYEQFCQDTPQSVLCQ